MRYKNLPPPWTLYWHRIEHVRYLDIIMRYKNLPPPLNSILTWDLTCKISWYHHEILKSATPLNSILTWDLTCKIYWYHHEVLKSATPLNSILTWDRTCKISWYHHEGLKSVIIIIIIIIKIEINWPGTSLNLRATQGAWPYYPQAPCVAQTNNRHVRWYYTMLDVTCKIRHPLELYIDMGSNM